MFLLEELCAIFMPFILTMLKDVYMLMGKIWFEETAGTTKWHANKDSQVCFSQGGNRNENVAI